MSRIPGIALRRAGSALRFPIVRRMLLAIVLLLVMAASGSVSRAGTTQGRIVGGSPAAPASWPFIVNLVATGDPMTQPFCGGTLIDPGWVLTAAHCTFNQLDQPVGAGDIEIVIGITNLASPTANTQRIALRGATGIHRHPSYLSDGSFRDDVALLELATPVTQGPDVAVADLTDPLDTVAQSPGRTARIAGWGDTSGAGTFATSLREASVQMLPDASCSAHGASYIPSKMLCAGFDAGGIDACQGDSGGPLTVTSSIQPRQVVAGAVSWGTGCALAGLPGVYTHLAQYRGFIYSTIGVAPPGAPIGISVANTATSATVSWNPPATNGGRAITAYEMIARSDSAIVNRMVVPVTDLSAVAAGLMPGARYSFTVVASNPAGIGPGAIVTPPSPTIGPAVVGIARVGRRLDANPGIWQDTPNPLAIQWQSCDPTGTTCADIPGATGVSHRPSQVDLGRTFRIAVTATNTASSTVLTSLPTGTALPAFTVTKTRVPRVTIARNGIATVSLGLRAESRARLSIQVRDHRGRLQRPIRRASRIGGVLPGLRLGHLIGRVKNATLHGATVAFQARPKGIPRTVRIVIVATNDEGDRTETTFRVRVRL